MCASSLQRAPRIPETRFTPRRSSSAADCIPKLSNTRAGPAAYVREPHASVTVHGCSRQQRPWPPHIFMGAIGSGGDRRTTVMRRSPLASQHDIRSERPPPTHQFASVPLEPFCCFKASVLRQSEAAAPGPSGPDRMDGRSWPPPAGAGPACGPGADRLHLTAAIAGH